MLYNKDQQIQTSIRNFFLKNNYKFILSHDNDININTKRFFSNVLRIIAFPLNFLALLVMINPKALTIPFIIHDATNLNKNNKFLEHQQNYKKNII